MSLVKKITDPKDFERLNEMFNRDMTEFEEIFMFHIETFRDILSEILDEIETRLYVHDSDKILNENIYDTYNKYFPELKKIPFGTEDYKNFEKKYFSEAHEIHVQQRHHFYGEKSNVDEVDLIDLIEAIVDIYASAKQYGGLDNVMSILESKGLFDLDLKSLTNNAINHYIKEKK